MFRHCLVLVPLALAADASAQDLTVRLMTPLQAGPANLTILGPDQAIYPSIPAPIVVPPQSITAFGQYVLGPAANITATTGEGATSIVVPAQSVPVDLDPSLTFTCPLSRPCQTLSVLPFGGITMELESFTIDLSNPVPDPEGSCLMLQGAVNSAPNAQSPTQSLSLLALPAGPVIFGPAPPGGYPISIPENYTVMPPQTASFLPTPSVTLQVCGDVPDPRRGLLDYTIVQAGGDWRWTATGQWEVTIQDNGALGDGHYALVRHVSAQDQKEGLLIGIQPGQVGWLHGPVERVNDPVQESLWEMDPLQHPPPEAEAYRFAFTPDPGLAGQYTLVFAEPSGLPHSTGQTNRLEVNNPAALTLSYFFRDHSWAGHTVEFPVTQFPQMDAPVLMTMPGGGELELSYTWHMPED